MSSGTRLLKTLRPSEIFLVADV